MFSCFYGRSNSSSRPEFAAACSVVSGGAPPSRTGFDSARFDLTEMSAGELAVIAAAGQIAAAQCHWLVELGNLDPAGGECRAFYSKAAWLSWRCSMHMRTASEFVAVADKLKILPLTTGEFSCGRLSYSQVRMLARVATPEIEQDLVEIARASTVGQLSKVVGTYRSILEAEADAQAQREGRSLATWFDDQGFFIMRGRFCPEDGAVIDRALRKVMESMTASTPATESPEEPPGRVFDHFGAHRADALAQMAREHLAGVAEGRPSATVPEVIVHYDMDSLKPGAACHLQEGIAIARSTAERIACDCAVVPLIEDGKGNPLWIGRRSRVISPAMRRALMARDNGCRFPGCPSKRHLEGHHSRHWIKGGETNLDNVLHLCSFHHRLVHGGGYSVKPVRSGFEFYRPDGTLLPQTHTPPKQSGEIESENRRRGLLVEEGAISSGWDGERMNLGYVMEALFLSREAKLKKPIPEPPRSTEPPPPPPPPPPSV